MKGQSWLAVVVATAVSGAVFAQEARDSKAPQGTGGAPDGGTSGVTIFGANQLVGHVHAVDRAGSTVTIDRAGTSTSFNLTDATTVFVDGRLGSTADLKPGEEVRAAYQDREGQFALRWIEVAPTGPDTFAGTGDGKSEAQSNTGSTSVGGVVQPVVGRVVSVNAAMSRLVVQQGEEAVTLSLNAATQVRQNGQSCTLGDLKQGQQIRASLNEGRFAATAIEIVAPAGTAFTPTPVKQP